MADETSIRAAFKPHQQVIEVLKDDPGASNRQIIRSVKDRVMAADNSRRLEDCRQLELEVQGDISRRFDDQASSIWAQVLWKLPEKVMKFAINAVQDTLPHNANPHLWKKLPSPNCPMCSDRQTLLHALDHCPVALQNRCYNQGHDAVLELLYRFTCTHRSSHQQVIVDLPYHPYCFPAPFACTDSRPDLVIWSKEQASIHLAELTVLFKTTREDAAMRKRERYSELLQECSRTAKVARLITVEVGS